MPEILEAKYKTKTASLSEFKFSGIYSPWHGFEDEVRQTFLSLRWSNSLLSAHRTNPHPNDLIHETFLVGDDLSLSGRFVQHVLRVMTAVARDLNIPVRFGDHKTLNSEDRKRGKAELRRQSAVYKLSSQTDTTVAPSPEKNLLEVPDFVTLDGQERARFVGEFKTPWTQNLTALKSDDIKWRGHIG